MKKIILIFILLFSYSSVNATIIEYDKPKFKTIDGFLTNDDIEPWYNPQPKDRIAIYEPYLIDNIDLLTATKFCDLLSQTYISHILEDNTTNKVSVLYYPDNLTWWDYDDNMYRFTIITCDTIEAIAPTWESTIIINNINEDKGINKEIFDEVTLIEIYQYEALIMVFILMWIFFNRIIWKKPKRENFNF